MINEFKANHDHNDSDKTNYLGPMLIIVLFIVIEIVPFIFVLDWNFMEIFVAKQFPATTTEPLFEP
jgi:hypothetical protein